jgi:hypothetical protein
MTATDIPLPYVRPIHLEKERKVTHTYRLEVSTSASIVKKDTAGSILEQTIETKTYNKDYEVELITYSRKPTEDLERMFEVLDTIKQRMSKPWQKASKAQANDATLLFDTLEFVLQHAAASEWKISVKLTEETLKNATPKYDLRSWRAFQTSVGHMIRRMGGENLYGRQLAYLQATKKPNALTLGEWIDRLKTLNLYLPFCIISEEELKKLYENTTVDKWWDKGSMNAFRLLQILDSQAPTRWSLAAQKAGWDVHSNTAEDDLRRIFTAIEAEEDLTGKKNSKTNNDSRRSRPNNKVGQKGNRYSSRNGSSKSYNKRKDRNDRSSGRKDYREGRHHEKSSHGHRSGTKTDDDRKNKRPSRDEHHYISDHSSSDSSSSSEVDDAFAQLDLGRNDDSSSSHSSSNYGTAAHHDSSDASDSDSNNKNTRRNRHHGSGQRV